jgi:glycopeptide antibiotics resistance protein
MKHPFLKNPALFIWYLVFWIVISVTQYYLERNLFETNIGVTLVDVIISNTVFALLGIGVWYVVLGGKRRKQKPALCCALPCFCNGVLGLVLDVG